jgi:hypothetical protein
MDAANAFIGVIAVVYEMRKSGVDIAVESRECGRGEFYEL